MPQTRKTSTMPSATATVPVMLVEDEVIPAKPKGFVEIKPTLWQRIWYGARAEQVLAMRQTHSTPMRAPLDEVKAGVLAEMESIARTQGGVSGSPFATVMLPQGTRAGAAKKAETVQAKAAHGAEPRAPRRRMPMGVLVALSLLLVFGYTLWQGRVQQAQVAKKAAVDANSDAVMGPMAGKVTVFELAPEPHAKGSAKGVVAATPEVASVKSQGLQVGAAQLAQQMVPQTLPAAMPVVNQPGVLWLSTGLMNSGPTALHNIQVKLQVADAAGIPLLERDLVVEGPVVPGAALAPQRVVLNPITPERFVAQVPLAALKVTLTPVQATR